MATLPEQFKNALSNAEPESADVANAAAAHEEVRKVLQADNLLKGQGIDPILIGSYSREVSIRRVKDVDVFGRLTDPPVDLGPVRVLDEFDRVPTAKHAPVSSRSTGRSRWTSPYQQGTYDVDRFWRGRNRQVAATNLDS